MATLKHDGYQLHRHLIGGGDLLKLRGEVDAVARAAGSACVRHLCARSSRVAALAGDPRLLALIPSGFVAVRSILFDKTEQENWPVAWHQDLTIAVERRAEVAGYGPWSVKNGAPHVQAPLRLLQEMITLRLHLDDAAAENGALRVAAGSHRLGKMSPDEIVARVEADPPPLTCACAAGDALLMSPLLLHSSPRAVAPARRRVIHFEYAPREKLDAPLRWHEVALVDVSPTRAANDG